MMIIADPVVRATAEATTPDMAAIDAYLASFCGGVAQEDSQMADDSLHASVSAYLRVQRQAEEAVLLSYRFPLVVETGAIRINVVYRYLSAEEEEEAFGPGTPLLSESAMNCRLLSFVLADWDLTADGKPIPIMEEAISGLPLDIVYAISHAIGEDSRLRIEAKLQREKEEYGG